MKTFDGIQDFTILILALISDFVNNLLQGSNDFSSRKWQSISLVLYD